MKAELPPQAAVSPRLHSLDAVRAIALLLGVVLHAIMSFLPGMQVWLVADSERSPALALLFYVIHMMRMVAFFLIAGYVARFSFHKLGAARFYKDRARRIGIPLVASWPILLALIIGAAILGAIIAGGPKVAPPAPKFTYDDFPLMHLWFLYVLLLLYAAVALLRPLVNLLDRGGRLRAAGDVCVRFLLHQWIPLLLAAPLCLSLYFQPYWAMWFGIPTPDRSLIPNLPAAVAYGSAFALGWMAQRQADILALWQQRWQLNLLVALACTAICLWIAGIKVSFMPVPQGGLKLAYAACYSTGAFAWSFALVGMAQRFLSHYSARWRYLADASYWIYLIHLPLVAALQALVSRQDWPWQIKFPLILFLAFALMLITYKWWVRGSFIGAILNGAKKPPL